MPHRSSVHVEPRESGWAVVREGSGRATSVHPTQAEAAKEAREIARRDQTEFFLHAQDGRVREHRSYGEGTGEETPSADKGVVGQAAETVGAVTEGITAPVLGALGGTARGAERDAGRSGGSTSTGPDEGISDEKTGDEEEVRGSTDAERDHGFGALAEQYAGYEIYDEDGERIGKLDDLFVDENDQPEYVGVRMDPLITRSALIPTDVITVEDRLRRVVVSRPRSVVETGPSLGYDEEVTPEFEERVRRHYRLTVPQHTGTRSGYGPYYHRDDAELAQRERGRSGAAIPEVPTIPSQAGRREDLAEPGILEEEELRVRRSEEELKVGTREREAGAVRVRKRVRTDHERIVVPRKRVEVTVERVPVERQATSATEGTAEPEIRDDEIVVPVVEEEIVVEKRPVVKEEIRIRKEVVEDTEIVEEDVRREEVEVDDETTRRNP
jgi:uncharacterized protein (TIGR02271 family)